MNAAKGVKDQEDWVDFLKKPTTTLEMIKDFYQNFPPLTGHMVEDLYWAKRIDILEFYFSVDWFSMAGRDLCVQLLAAATASKN